MNKSFDERVDFYAKLANDFLTAERNRLVDEMAMNGHPRFNGDTERYIDLCPDMDAIDTVIDRLRPPTALVVADTAGVTTRR